MKLENKKALVSRSLNIGKNRISFNKERFAEIKEAITKQDIKDLKDSGAIIIKEIKGKKKIKKRKTRRRQGSVRKKVNKSKLKYMALTRKLRAHAKSERNKNVISDEDYKKIRQEIRASSFRSKAHMKERIAEGLTSTSISKHKTKKKSKKRSRRKKK